ncbi:MAG: hypothetical protein Q9187_006500 [Circinaria calcarea]
MTSPKSFRQLIGVSPSTASPSDPTCALIIIDAQNEYAIGLLKTANVSSTRKAITELLKRYRGAGGKIIHVVHKTSEQAPVFTTGKEVGNEFEELEVEQGEKAHVCVSTTARQASELGYDVVLAGDAIGDRDIPGIGGEELTKVSVKNLSTTRGCTNNGMVIVKTAPQYRLDNERDVLKSLRGRSYIRQLVDEVEDPPSLVLTHLDDNLLNASNSKKLKRGDIKFVAKRVLEALKVFHEFGYVHTGTAGSFNIQLGHESCQLISDVKPDNILVNYDTGSNRFSDVQLGDCGDTFRVDPNTDPNENGHIIGAAIFRSPEATLNLKWGTPTDIWSFGATLISLIFGKSWHIFKPDNLDPDDETFPLHVLIKQANFFGPFPLSYQEIADDERLYILTVVMNYIKENVKRKPFSMVQDRELIKEDREFICKIMKLDPRDRPTAEELLGDEWFNFA